MLAKLKKMMTAIGAERDSAAQADIEDHKIAAAALLVHASLIDGQLDEAEQNKLEELLQHNYELDEQETRQLIDLARKEDENAVDLYGFTRRLTRVLEPDERLEIIEMLWEIAFADGILHEFESNLIWRVAELMHVAPRDRIHLRQKVQARQKTQTPQKTPTSKSGNDPA